MDIEISKISELKKGVFYHINFGTEVNVTDILAFAQVLKSEEIKAFITVGEVTTETVVALVGKLSDDEKKLVIEELKKEKSLIINPTDYEQSK